MRILRPIGVIAFFSGLAVELIWFYDEMLFNFNYYYRHQVNFVLLTFFGGLLLCIGLFLMLWERKPK